MVEGDSVPIPGLRKPQRFWKISVADNGIGFDPAYAERIFVVFQRLHAASEYQGTGIGLAICRKIMQAHGGHITADGTPGKGSVFNIYLPLNL
ncbi:sensor histidine kinase [Puia sp. P3]|uniref:sensor histidine kinase n=1 Tax=Puia sp. P3 TaxID=3423952 RepID=UPI003D66CEB2